MKRTKRFFALMLALTLAFGIGVFAAVDETEPAEANVQTIYKQIKIKYGKDIVLNAEGLIPAEYEGWDVSYEWQAYATGEHVVIEGATGPVLRMSRRDAAYPDGKKVLGMVIGTEAKDYDCTAIVRNAAGDEVVLPLYHAEVAGVLSIFGWVVAIVFEGISSIVTPLFWGGLLLSELLRSIF